jgi:lipid-binding SYLF domain-containing protein
MQTLGLHALSFQNLWLQFLSIIAQTAFIHLAKVKNISVHVSLRTRSRQCRARAEEGECMKKLVTLVALLSLGAASTVWAESRGDVRERLDKAGNVLHEIMATPDKGIPEEVLDHAKCVAVVPNMMKGGFVFGAENGRGVATCRNAKGWSAPAFFAITGGSWGLQIGVEGVDVVLIIQNERGMQRFLAGQFQIGGDASAAAGPVGRHASADTNWKLDTEILTYSRAKGAFAGLTLTGASIRRDDSSTEAIYGHEISNQSILLGRAKVPVEARSFLDAVRSSKAQAVDAK